MAVEMNRVLVKWTTRRWWWGDRKKSLERISEICLGILNELGWQKTELSLYFVGRRKAKRLNIDYRKQDYIPQVLSFPMSKKADADGWTRLGDVVICLEKLIQETKIQKEEVDKILYTWVKHGMAGLTAN